ncbi:MAG: hypothetical protein WCK01_04420 [Candidatus Uhrbacteria bacterium]
MNERKSLFPPALMPLITGILFAIVFAITFTLLKQKGADSFDYVIKRIPSIRLYGMETAAQFRELARTWGVAVGAVLGFAATLTGYILYGILAIMRLTKNPWVATGISALAAGTLAGLGYMLDITIPHTSFSSALVYFFGIPLLYSGLGTIALIFILSLLSFRYAAPAIVSETK